MAANEEGWIKFHRKILKWEWWEDIICYRLFSYFLLMANAADQRWRGYEVKRGSFVTSSQRIEQDTKLTTQQVRTAMEHLKSTGEITCKTTNKFTMITVCNYERYQGVAMPQQQANQQANQQTGNKPTTNEQQTNNHKQEYKNNKEGFESSPPDGGEDMSGLMPDAPPSPENEEDIKLQIDYGKLAEYWNRKTKGRFGRILFIENNRRKMVRARIRMYGKRAFMQAIDIVCASEYLDGQSWFNFDWLIKPNNFDKVMSGNFDNKEMPTKDGNTTNTTESRLGLGTVTKPANKGMQTDI